MKVVSARGLARDPLDAAAEFLERVVPEVRGAMETGDLPACIVFDLADHTHRAWRAAVVQSLAREAAPGRVNAVAAVDDRVCAATLAYLDHAPGITGQYLALDGQGAGDPLG